CFATTHELWVMAIDLEDYNPPPARDFMLNCALARTMPLSGQTLRLETAFS
ncbi:hypothetical protein FRC12_024398, partial [Ceratobasidium sp. 428]